MINSDHVWTVGNLMKLCSQQTVCYCSAAACDGLLDTEECVHWSMVFFTPSLLRRKGGNRLQSCKKK